MWALSEAYVLLGLRFYLEWFGKFSSGGQHTHLGAHHPPSGVTFLTHHHKFSHSIFLSFSPFHFMCLSLSFSSLLLLGFTHNHEYGASFGRPWPPLMLPCAFFFNSAIASHSQHILFFIFVSVKCTPSHLTTRLSSCPVGIFLISSSLIVKKSQS